MTAPPDLTPGLQQEAEQAWEHWRLGNYIWRSSVADHPTMTRDVFLAGFKAVAESRDQRIKEWKAAARGVVENIGPISNVMTGRADLGIPRMVYVDVPEAAVAALSSLLEKGTDQ